VIHNAGVGYREPLRIVTEDGLCHVFAVNVLAPYVLTATMLTPDRLVYLSSGMHRVGTASVADLQWERRRWDGSQAYADSKLYDAVLSAAVARYRSDTLSNAVEPGWVPTKMGGPGAPDDMDLAPVTQAWLAVSDDPGARVSGGYSTTSSRRRRTPPCTTQGSRTNCSRPAPGSVVWPSRSARPTRCARRSWSLRLGADQVVGQRTDAGEATRQLEGEAEPSARVSGAV